MAVVTVEEVNGRAAVRRFFEFAFLQFRTEPRWSPPVVAHERARLDPQRNPFFDSGDGEYFLARRAGVVAGRITAHIASTGEPQGWFGFYDTIDDASVAVALLDAAAAWLRDHGCTAMTGPASFTPADDPGVLVAGFEMAGTTGRPWHPPWYAAQLEAAGLERTDDRPMWRLATQTQTEPARQPEPTTNAGGWMETPAGRFADPRLLLDSVVAVPDLTAARGSTFALARRSKRADWDTCTIVSMDGDPAVLVPRVRAAAYAAGYEWVISPWTPDSSAPPETRHARFTRAL